MGYVRLAVLLLCWTGLWAAGLDPASLLELPDEHTVDRDAWLGALLLPIALLLVAVAMRVPGTLGQVAEAWAETLLAMVLVDSAHLFLTQEITLHLVSAHLLAWSAVGAVQAQLATGVWVLTVGPRTLWREGWARVDRANLDGGLLALGTVLFSALPPPEEAPRSVGRIGPLWWFGFDAMPDRRVWRTARFAGPLVRRAVPMPPSDGHGFDLDLQTPRPLGPSIGTRVLAWVLVGVALLAVLPTIGVVEALSAPDFPQPFDTHRPVGMLPGFGWAWLVVILPSLGAAGLFLWEEVVRQARPVASRVRLHGDILDVDGERFYLRGATATLSHGVHGATLRLEGPDGVATIRGEHQTLAWLRHFVNHLQVPAEPPEEQAAEAERLRRAVAARSTEGQSTR